MNIFDSWMVKKQIAHRGLYNNEGGLPENSIPAFEKAIANEYAIEMDVHMSTDGEIVVFHDDILNRMTDGDGDIREKSYDEIKKLTLKNSTEKIPTFDEFLKLINCRTPLLIEIKSHKNIGVLEAKLTEKLNAYKGEFAVQSFNPFIVKWFKDNAPQFTRGQLATFLKKESDIPNYQKFLLKKCYLNFLTKPHFVSYDVNYINKISRRIKSIKKKMPILMWTVHADEERKKYGALHNNIIFENYIPSK